MTKWYPWATVSPGLIFERQIYFATPAARQRCYAMALLCKFITTNTATYSGGSRNLWRGTSLAESFRLQLRPCRAEPRWVPGRSPQKLTRILTALKFANLIGVQIENRLCLLFYRTM